MSRVDIAWKELLASARTEQRTELPLGEHDFQQIAWARLDPRRLADALIDPRKSYPGHMEVLFAAFTGWVFAPKNTLFQRAVTRHAIRRFAARFERRSGANSIITSFVRRTFTGLNFTESIYLPAGGMAGLSSTPSKSRLARRRSAIDADALIPLRLAHQFHHLVPEFSDGLIARPSMKKLAGTPGKSRNIVNPLWRIYRDSIALRYAATSMSYCDQSLWQALVEDKVRAGLPPSEMALWLGRARWYATTILMHCADEDTARTNLINLPDVEHRPFAPPSPEDQFVVHGREKLSLMESRTCTSRG